MDYSITLRLSGTVDLDKLVVAVTSLKSLVDALSNEVASGVRITWNVQELQAGSAMTTFEGVAQEPDYQAEVEKIVRAFEEVGASIERGLNIPYSSKVSQAAYKIIDVIDDEVDEVFFETAEREAVITGDMREKAVRSEEEINALYSYGAIEGKVQTLSSRSGLRFTLFDIFGRSIPCYLSSGDEEMMRNVWEKWVVVEGYIRRDFEGKPISIRRVSDVRIRETHQEHGYRRARGALRSASVIISAEEAIRHLRDD